MKRIATFLLAAVFVLQVYAQDTYLEFKTTAGKQDVMAMKIYIHDGNTRMEITSDIAGAGINMSMLVLKQRPDMVYMLNTASKTYSEINSKALDEGKADNAEYTVTVVGKEKIQGYNCVHTSITDKKGKIAAIEMWTTQEIPGYKELAVMQGSSAKDANLQKLLEEKGAAGFPVKVYSKEGGNEVLMQLIKAEKKALAANLFSLDGYKKSDGFEGLGIDLEQIQKEYENLSPEEREAIQKMLEQQDKTQPK